MNEIYPYDLQVFDRLAADAAAVESAVRESVREALLMHKRLGNPLATWRDGQVVWIPAEEISVEGWTEPH